jgi:predicted nucleic acid-binding Zn ribbon protein
MFSERFYKILHLIFKYTCLTGANGIQLNPKTASTFLTAKSRKRNNFGVMYITILALYCAIATTLMYFQDDTDQFPLCYMLALALIILWLVVFTKFVQKEELSIFFTKIFAFTIRFQSKTIHTSFI